MRLRTARSNFDLLPVVVTTQVKQILPLVCGLAMKCMTSTFFIAVPCFPHYHREACISSECSLKFTMCFLSCLLYRMSLSPGDTDETVYGEAIPNTPHRYRYKKSAFPQPLPTLPVERGCL